MSFLLDFKKKKNRFFPQKKNSFELHIFIQNLNMVAQKNFRAQNVSTDQ